MKRCRNFLKELFAKFHLKKVVQEQDVEETLPPVNNRGDRFKDGGGDAWNVTLSSTARENNERVKTVGARQHQRQPELQPERCA